jgi:two-component system LytT family response regulator
MINCIIVDDEQHAIDILRHYIEQTPQLRLAGATTNPMEGLQLVATQPIDLVFLDIQMPELSGMDFIKAINGRAKVILTTAYSEFALEGYELDVVDYLLKPIRLPRFLQAVQKLAKENIHEPVAAQEEEFIFVKTELKGKLVKINLCDIDYIEGMKNFVAIHCGTNKILIYTTLRDLEQRLSSKQFMRVHRSFIIPVGRITGIEGNMVRLKNVKAEVLIGEMYKENLMKMVKGKTID